MKVVNNLEKIRSLLKFEKGVFYFVQVIQRKKENPEIHKHMIHRGFYFIESMENYDRYFSEIEDKCNIYNARAYISLLPRSHKKLTQRSMIEFSERVFREEYHSPWNLTYKLAGSIEVSCSREIFGRTRWLLDFDSLDEIELDKIKSELSNLTKIIDVIPTLNGYHIYIEAFDCRDFSLKKEIKKDCNTILYSIKK